MSCLCKIKRASSGIGVFPITHKRGLVIAQLHANKHLQKRRRHTGSVSGDCGWSMLSRVTTRRPSASIYWRDYLPECVKVLYFTAFTIGVGFIRHGCYITWHVSYTCSWNRTCWNIFQSHNLSTDTVQQTKCNCTRMHLFMCDICIIFNSYTNVRDPHSEIH